MTGEGGVAKPAVAVFRAQLLPGSETFIRDQADALTSWRPVAVGALRVASPLARPADLVLYDAAPPDAPEHRTIRDRAALLAAEMTGVAPRITRELRRLRDDEGVRLVHAHFAKDAWLVARAARRAGLPLVVTCHGYDVTSLPARRGLSGAVYRWRTRRVLARAAAVVAVSGFIADRARELGAAEPVVVHTGVRLRGDGAEAGEPGDGAIPGVDRADVDWVDVDRADGGQSDADRTTDILFVGRLVPKKGVDDLLRAIPEVEAALGRPVRARIVGDGPLRAELGELARELGIGESVTFTGALPTARVDAEMAAAKVFCGPSRTAPDGDSEGFGQVFLEAALAGTPVVSRRHGGIAEAVAHGETGLLGEPGDDAAPARDLARLLADDDLRRDMGRRARERAMAAFDMDRCVVRLEELYSAAAAPPRPVR